MLLFNLEHKGNVIPRSLGDNCCKIRCQTNLRTLKRAEDGQAGIPQSEHFLYIVKWNIGADQSWNRRKRKAFRGGPLAIPDDRKHDAVTVTGTGKRKPGGTAWLLAEN